MSLLNLTPHQLTLVGDNGTITVPPSGQVARLAVTRTALAPVEIDGVTLPVSQPTLGEIVGLPAPAPGVILVVSARLIARPQAWAEGRAPHLVNDGIDHGPSPWGRDQE